MQTLFIDLASHSTLSDEGACIACVEASAETLSEPKASRRVDDTHTKAIHFIDERISDDGLMPALEHTLASAAWKFEDITHIACVIGPGGFTSLRMAVSLANVLGDQLRIPLVGIHLSDLYRARVPPPLAPVKGRGPHGALRPPPSAGEGKCLWLHSTKKTQLFARTFGMDGSQWEEPTLVSIDELKFGVRLSHGSTGSPQVGTVVPKWNGELIPEHRSLIEEWGLQEMSLVSIAEALPALLKNLDYKKQVLVPWYGRGW